MNAAISKAAMKQPFKVLGRHLKPFSIWHQLFLESVESRYAVGANWPQPASDMIAEFIRAQEDLIISAYFCSYDYEGGLEQLESRLLRTRLSLWGWRCGNYDLNEAVEYFTKYIRHYSAYPNYWVESGHGNGGKSGVPYAQFLKVKMMQEFGMSEAEALNTPYNTAIINYLTTLEAKGVVRFMTDEDEALIAETKKREKWLDELGQRVRNN